ncbi:hypothetical protein Syun_011650 [Stephania yunnanensis]|uniref:Uncharacterized protein n=1 Tax=Stephania yunnanensis TaxID=152371 RepID=A0AAP0JYZ2_9MAGN
MNVGRAAMANLVGGIGYFYGQSKIALARTKRNEFSASESSEILSFLDIAFIRLETWSNGSIPLKQDLNEEANRAFPDDKLLTKYGKPKEFFFSSDAQALVEHTRKVLVIEDGEVVHFKWTFLYYLSFKAFHISWLPKLCSVQGSVISSNLKALFPAWYFAFTYFTADCIGILTDQNKLVVAVGEQLHLPQGFTQQGCKYATQVAMYRRNCALAKLFVHVVRNGIYSVSNPSLIRNGITIPLLIESASTKSETEFIPSLFRCRLGLETEFMQIRDGKFRF